MQKVRVTRFECFHTSASWKSNQQSFFYLDLARDGTKEEKASRKELAKLLGQEKRRTERYAYHQNVEGIGYSWRVEAAIITKYADWLDLPCTVEEELQRFKRDGIRHPSEQIMVNRITIHDIEKPHLITLQFSTSHDQLRRALDQYLEDHWQTRDDWMGIDTYGASVTITRGMLQIFLAWFSFADPLGDMLKEAMEEAKERAEQMKQWEEQRRQWQREQEQSKQEREQEQYEQFRRNYSQYRYYYSGYRSTSVPRRSAFVSALETFSLDAGATLQDVKKRYRVLAKLYHPDTGGDEEQFKKINAANQVLMQHLS